MERKALAMVLAMAVCGTAGLGAGQSAQKLNFEVVSIKVDTSSDPVAKPISVSGSRFVANNYTLRALVNWAYRASNGSAFLQDQIKGLPSWAGADHFDIEATPEGEVRPVRIEEMRAMVQTMLQDRFKLKSHRETHQDSIYVLTVVKRGKIKLSPDQSPAPPSVGPRGLDPNNPPRGAGWSTVGRTRNGILQGMLVASAVPITNLVSMLQAAVGSIVVDKTDLKGLFDFNVKYTPELELSAPSTNAAGGLPGAADPVAPSLFTALQEELGLKLESSKGAVEVLVIDSVQKPSQN